MSTPLYFLPWIAICAGVITLISAAEKRESLVKLDETRRSSLYMPVEIRSTGGFLLVICGVGALPLCYVRWDWSLFGCEAILVPIIGIAFFRHSLARVRFFSSTTGQLMWAVKGGHAEDVRKSLVEGADIDAVLPDLQCTALYLAVIKGHAEIVNMLLEHGADVKKDEIPILYPAARSREVEIIKALMARGASPDQRCTGKVNGYLLSCDLYVERGLCPNAVRQMVKEALDGAELTGCGVCKSVARGVSRDYFICRSVTADVTRIGNPRAWATKTEVIAQQSFFVCLACIESSEKGRHTTKADAGNELLSKLAGAWFEASRSQYPVPDYAGQGPLSWGVSLVAAKEFYQVQEVGRISRQR